MAEKIIVAPVRHRGRPVRMDARLARHLVARGTFTFVDVQRVPEKPAPKKVQRAARKRTPKAKAERKPAKKVAEPEKGADVEFTTADALDNEVQPPKKRTRKYERRDMEPGE